MKAIILAILIGTAYIPLESKGSEIILCQTRKIAEVYNKHVLDSMHNMSLKRKRYVFIFTYVTFMKNKFGFDEEDSKVCVSALLQHLSIPRILLDERVVKQIYKLVYGIKI